MGLYGFFSSFQNNSAFFVFLHPIKNSQLHSLFLHDFKFLGYTIYDLTCMILPLLKSGLKLKCWFLRKSSTIFHFHCWLPLVYYFHSFSKEKIVRFKVNIKFMLISMWIIGYSDLRLFPYKKLLNYLIYLNNVYYMMFFTMGFFITLFCESVGSIFSISEFNDFIDINL